MLRRIASSFVFCSLAATGAFALLAVQRFDRAVQSMRSRLEGI
jgi:hypothetical protein